MHKRILGILSIIILTLVALTQPPSIYADACTSGENTLVLNNGKPLLQGNHSVPVILYSPNEFGEGYYDLHFVDCDGDGFSYEPIEMHRDFDDATKYYTVAAEINYNVLSENGGNCSLEILFNYNEYCTEDGIFRFTPGANSVELFTAPEVCSGKEFNMSIKTGPDGYRGNFYLTQDLDDDGKCDGGDKVLEIRNLATETQIVSLTITADSSDWDINRRIHFCPVIGNSYDEETSNVEPFGSADLKVLKPGGPQDQVCEEDTDDFEKCQQTPIGQNMEYYCNNGTPSTDDASCVCLPENVSPDQFNNNSKNTSVQVIPVSLCERLGSEEKGLCEDCIQIDHGVWSGLGCIPIGNINSFVIGFLGFAAGVGGGITFLLIVAAGFTYMTSQGNPEKIQSAREIMTNAIAGLLLILFSAVIMRIIGVDILKIPGLGGGA